MNIDMFKSKNILNIKENKTSDFQIEEYYDKINIILEKIFQIFMLMIL